MITGENIHTHKQAGNYIAETCKRGSKVNTTPPLPCSVGVALLPPDSSHSNAFIVSNTMQKLEVRTGHFYSEMLKGAVRRQVAELSPLRSYSEDGSPYRSHLLYVVIRQYESGVLGREREGEREK